MTTGEELFKKPPVVIIGAGFSGLIALKTCKENGFDAVCYERTDNFGGLWRFRGDDLNGVASVTRTTIVNTSKEMSAMSDFPPPASAANYMHHKCVIDYLEGYARQFDILDKVQFGVDVVKVNKSIDYEDTGEWTVGIKRQNNEQVEVRASAILVCIGHHVFPNVPDFPGLADFRGNVIHTHSYKDSVNFVGKRVLVVGIGNSGMDAAVDTSFTATQVYLSTRRGGWVVARVGANGVPMDFTTSRFNSLIYKHFPNYHVTKMEEKVNEKFDHELYNLKPKHHIDGQHPIISDQLPSRIIGGAVKIKGDVERFTVTGVIFKNEDNQIYEVDVVIFATGYKIKFPFIDSNIIADRDDNHFELYRRIIPPKIAAVHPTLAIIGLVQPVGAIFPHAEMQCRWMAKVIKGEIKLPSEAKMIKEVKDYKLSLKKRYVDSKRHTIEVDYVPYMDTLASEIGCKPNLIKLFLTDPKLFRKVFFGPAVAYQYRLKGPHAWNQARDAIIKVDDRMKAAFHTRKDMIDIDGSQGGRCWLPYSMVVMFPCILTITAYYASMTNPELVNYLWKMFN